MAEYRKLGAETVEISLPNSHWRFRLLCGSAGECSSNQSALTGYVTAIVVIIPKDLLDLYTRSRAEGFGAEVQRRILVGTFCAVSTGYYDAYYLKAQQIRRLISDDFRRAFEQVDVIAGPTSPTVAFNLGEKVDDPITMYLSDIYTIGSESSRLAQSVFARRICRAAPCWFAIDWQLLC